MEDADAEQLEEVEIGFVGERGILPMFFDDAKIFMIREDKDNQWHDLARLIICLIDNDRSVQFWLSSNVLQESKKVRCEYRRLE